MTVRDLLASMTSSEFAEWMAFDSIDPFGEPREDLRSGLLAATFVNHSMRPPRTPAVPLDFMPFVMASKPEPLLLEDPDEHARLIEKTLFGGLLVKDGNDGSR